MQHGTRSEHLPPGNYMQAGGMHPTGMHSCFLRFWTNNVTNLLKVTSVISPPTCHLRFLIIVLETL